LAKFHSVLTKTFTLATAWQSAKRVEALRLEAMHEAMREARQSMPRTVGSRAPQLRRGSVRIREAIEFIRGTSVTNVGLMHDQRAVGLTDILSRGASIFSPAMQATPALFARSRPVLRYGFFVSHSWSASRWEKYFGLLYRFSFVPALVAMHLASLLAGALFVAGVLPPMATLAFADLPGVQVPGGAYCQLIGTAAFVAVLLGWVRLVSLAEAVGLVARRECFVDKMCISQIDDSDAKVRGIDQIGRFLRNSEELLILWSPDYFSRLWCCFEIAVYLHLGERGALKKPSGATALRSALQQNRGSESRSVSQLSRGSTSHSASMPSRGSGSTSASHSASLQRRIVLVPLPLAKAGLLLGGNCAPLHLHIPAIPSGTQACYIDPQLQLYHWG
jgi:hypothetical protein